MTPSQDFGACAPKTKGSWIALGSIMLATAGCSPGVAHLPTPAPQQPTRRSNDREGPSQREIGCSTLERPIEMDLGTTTKTREIIYESIPEDRPLQIARFRWNEKTIAVRRIIDAEDSKPSRVEASEVAIALLDPIVIRSRAALDERSRLPTPSEEAGIGWVNGGRFRLFLRITDVDRPPLERVFTGTESSETQRALLPLRLATAPLAELLRELPFTETAITEADRRVFSERFLALRGDELIHRTVHLAGSFGTPDIVPALASIVRDDRHFEFTRAKARDAILQISLARRAPCALPSHVRPQRSEDGHLGGAAAR